MWPFRRRPKSRGQRGEDAAVRYLRRLGYRIVERNAVYGRHELDAIAWDGDTLVFVEVRSIATRDGVDPADTVDFAKQRRLREGARLYLSRLDGPEPFARFDVVSVVFGEGKAPEITHYIDAFRG